MKVDASSLLTVGRIRYVQHALERGPYQNPDRLVQHFLDPGVREETDAFIRAHTLREFTSNAFYNYVLLRTLYYDDLLLRSVSEGVSQVVIIGAGTDTRAYRFEDVLVARNALVIECDQPEAIVEKQRDAQRISRCAHVRFCPIDLAATDPSAWASSAGYDGRAATLFLVEGVTPYVTEQAFGRWLRFMAGNGHPRTRVGCDYKLSGADDAFGQVDGQATLRLSGDETSIDGFHRRHGLRVRQTSCGEQLRRRFHAAAEEERPPYSQDVIVEAEPALDA